MMDSSAGETRAAGETRDAGAARAGGLTRREALRTMARTPVGLSVLGALGGVSAMSMSSCEADSPSAAEKRVVLYSSADDEILRTIVGQFEKAARVKVAVVTDTEATKTTGLVLRLLDERSAPRADVWWSSEPLGTVRLARDGVLGSVPETLISAGWPTSLVGADRAWVGFARRARVIAFSTKRVAAGERPGRLRELIEPRWKGRIGMARPQFGTTRTQMAALLAAAGDRAMRGWLRGLSANEVRLYDGNASVVRAIAQGEIDVGLTDSDDAWAAKRNGWAVESVFESRDDVIEVDEMKVDGNRVEDRLKIEGELASNGPLLMPNTVSVVRGGPNGAGGLKLVKFLLSAGVERALAASDSRNIPVSSSVASEFEALRVPTAWEPDWEQVAGASDEAMKICGEMLKG